MFTLSQKASPDTFHPNAKTLTAPAASGADSALDATSSSY